MNKKRPINLDLTSLKFPPMAIASILHRIAGVILFLFLPVLMYLLSLSLSSEELFAQTKMMLHHPVYQFILWGFGAALFYHLFAGIRHLIMDIGYGEELTTGKATAILVIVLGIISTIVLGILIW